MLLDAFMSDGRVPDQCTIQVRRYEGDVPPDHRSNTGDVIGVWKYQFYGPDLVEQDLPAPPFLPSINQPPFPLGRASTITISYPTDLPFNQEGLVSFDCVFDPFTARGWVYHVARREGSWTFSQVRQTWSR